MYLPVSGAKNDVFETITIKIIDDLWLTIDITMHLSRKHQIRV
jgi:hypothetical protein